MDNKDVNQTEVCKESENLKEVEHKKEDNRILSILAYIPLLWLIGLCTKKDDKDVMFHVNQGIILTIFTLVPNLLHMFPMIRLLSFAISVLSFAFMIIGFVNAYKRENKPLPLIGNLFTFVG